MNREALFEALHQNRMFLKSRGVKSIAVFGSVARGDFSEKSDLDLLVEFDRPIGLFDFIRLKYDLEKTIGRRVDLVTPDALHPKLRDRILSEAVYVS